MLLRRGGFYQILGEKISHPGERNRAVVSCPLGIYNMRINATKGYSFDTIKRARENEVLLPVFCSLFFKAPRYQNDRFHIKTNCNLHF